ncbi:hypothetical protein [Pseudomonas monteilii]|uniref:hypothetical protein n=1 Tax=Pseudomonas monteilii TaxID=76759 RepID=UPI003905DD8F
MEEVLKGRDVIDAFKSDIEGFFYPTAGFVMNISVQGTRTAYRGSADSGGILISTDLAECEVDSLKRMMFILLVLGHETAHLLNVHGGFRDESNQDTKALEVWADFFGTKVAMVAMTIGDRIQDMVTGLPGGKETGARVEAIGAAIGLLGTTYFETGSTRYEPAPVRVATCVAGVMSALDTFWSLNGIPRNVGRSMSLQLRLYKSPAMRLMLSKVEGTGVPERGQFPTIRRIHQHIQSDRTSITVGMLPIPSAWLHTNYEGSEQERMAEAERQLDKLKEELAKLGLDLPEDW